MIKLKFKSDIFHNFFRNSKHLLGKYYQENKERLQNECYKNLLEDEKQKLA